MLVKKTIEPLYPLLKNAPIVEALLDIQVQLPKGKDLKALYTLFDKVKNILIAGGLYDEGTDIEKTYNEKIEPELIELATGEAVSKDKFDDVLNIKNFDILTLADNPKYGNMVINEPVSEEELKKIDALIDRDLDKLKPKSKK